MAQRLAAADYIKLTQFALALATKVASEVKEKRSDDGKISLEEGFEIVNTIAPQILEIVMVFVRDDG